MITRLIFERLLTILRKIMYNVLVERLPRVEGCLKVVLEQTTDDTSVFLSSGRSTMMENRLIGKYPLEAIQLTQQLSEKNGVAHAIAAAQALEDLLKVTATPVAQQVRSILLKLSALHSHIHHFYWEFLPDYLNQHHYDSINRSQYFPGVEKREAKPGDLSSQAAEEILKNVPLAAHTLQGIQQILTLISGKYPMVMNVIPGGLTNFNISPKLLMEVIRKLETFKHFVDAVWPNDVKRFIQDNPATLTIFDDTSNFISFGSPEIDKGRNYSYYSSGVSLDGKLEPINELKITESFASTFHVAPSNTKSSREEYNLEKSDAKTWIKGARYETETMLAGALSRMMVTYLGGGNVEISDTIGQMLEDLGLNTEYPNCIASRLLAEVFEGRFYMKAIAELLLMVDPSEPVNLRKKLLFNEEGSGVGKVESPEGPFHQVHLKSGRISRYRIISPVNWNFSPRDEFGRTGVVETELNKMLKNYTLTSLQAARIIHSHNACILDGAQ